jgi:UDP-2,3-diacylglucosamine hydrolase
LPIVFLSDRCRSFRFADRFHLAYNFPMESLESLGIIAGNGVYPLLTARAARAHGVRTIHVAAFEGETSSGLQEVADSIEWMRVGQLNRLLKYFERWKIRQIIMAGQIAPKNLFDLRPDLRALLLLGQLRPRNAETLFGAVADELQKIGATLLPATTFLEDDLAPLGLIAGPKPKKRQLEDIEFGFELAKEVSRLDIGQTVIVKNGSVLAVEAFEGTNEAIKRGGALGQGGATMVKVSKPNQDVRFDVPVIGTQTIAVAGEAGVKIVAVEATRTLLLDRGVVAASAEQHGITLFGAGK